MRLIQWRFSLIALLLPTAGCANLLLRSHRNDALLAEYRYALGEKHIEIDGLKLCYQDVGRGEPVLLLPGLGTSIDFWQQNVDALSKDYRVVAVDPPGFGKSAKPDVPYELPWMADRIVAFMDALQLERVSIIGGSMGGHIALLIALKHPQRVDKLVLMGTVGAWEPPGFLLAGAIRLFWNDWLFVDHIRRNWPGIYDSLTVRQTHMTQSLRAYQLALRADGTRYWPEGRTSSRALKAICFASVRDRLAEVRAPTLLLWGRHDRIHNWHWGMEYRTRIPDSRLIIVEDSGHEVMIDHADRFNTLTADFLRSGTAAIRDEIPCP